ncbi:MAG: class I SAM-dependent methyltransferase, partial [Chroococcidiopsis sp.]
MSKKCRFCGNELRYTFANLGMSPIANDNLTSEHLNRAEKFYPLHTYVCDRCLLVQLEEFESPEHIFGDGDYAYFSSYSDSWLRHAKAYTELMVERF